jgi:hypothetical protein
MNDYTTDGVEIRAGLRVFTNNCRWGTVQGPALGTPGWWDVQEDDAGRPMLDGTRMATRSPFGDLDPNPA